MIDEINVNGVVHKINDTEARKEIENKADKTEIPTKTSDLQNDSGFITEIPEEYAKKTDIPSIEGLATEEYVDNAIANINIPEGGGSGEICELLLDVTTTERVTNISQSIDNIAYKYLYVIGEACGHADNNTQNRLIFVTLENINGETIKADLGIIINQGTTRRYAKMWMSVTDKLCFADSQSNIRDYDDVGLSNQRSGIHFSTWGTNTLKNINIGTGVNSIEVGAKFKIWGVRA